jgi:hypothetical protein
MFREAADTAMQMKDLKLLADVRERCGEMRLQSEIDRMMSVLHK